jgi:hypothetical protein
MAEVLCDFPELEMDVDGRKVWWSGFVPPCFFGACFFFTISSLIPIMYPGHLVGPGGIAEAAILFRPIVSPAAASVHFLPISYFASCRFLSLF